MDATGPMSADPINDVSTSAVALVNGIASPRADELKAAVNKFIASNGKYERDQKERSRKNRSELREAGRNLNLLEKMEGIVEGERKAWLKRTFPNAEYQTLNLWMTFAEGFDNAPPDDQEKSDEMNLIQANRAVSPYREKPPKAKTAAQIEADKVKAPDRKADLKALRDTIIEKRERYGDDWPNFVDEFNSMYGNEVVTLKLPTADIEVRPEAKPMERAKEERTQTRRAKTEAQSN